MLWNRIADRCAMPINLHLTIILIHLMIWCFKSVLKVLLQFIKYYIYNIPFRRGKGVGLLKKKETWRINKWKFVVLQLYIDFLNDFIVIYKRVKKINKINLLLSFLLSLPPRTLKVSPLKRSDIKPLNNSYK